MEEEARRDLEADKATFMRNWSYAYALCEEGPKVEGKFTVMPFPSFEGGGKAAILGGHNLVISVYSKNPGGALKFIDFRPARRHRRRRGPSTPWRRRSPPSTTTRPSRRRCLRDAAQAVGRAGQGRVRSRPSIRRSREAIYKNVNAALAGAGVTGAGAEEARRPRSKGPADLLSDHGSRLPPRPERPQGGAPEASRTAASRRS